MVDTLKVRSFSYRQRWGDAAEPAPAVERSTQLNDHLRMRDSIGEQLESARKTIALRIDELLESHGRSGLVRTGATLKAGIAVCADLTGYLIDTLIAAVPAPLRSRETFDLVDGAVAHLLGFIDGQLKRIVATIEQETQDRTLARRYEDAALRVWGEERAAVLGRLEHYRAAFLAPAPMPGFASLADEADSETEGTIMPEETTVATGDIEQPRPTQSHVVAEAPQLERELPTDALPGEVWADLAVALWTGKVASRTRAGLEEALRQALARTGQADADSVATAATAARLVWDRYTARNHVRSTLPAGNFTQACDLRTRAPATFGSDSAGWSPARQSDEASRAVACSLGASLDSTVGTANPENRLRANAISRPHMAIAPPLIELA